MAETGQIAMSTYQRLTPKDLDLAVAVRFNGTPVVEVEYRRDSLRRIVVDFVRLQACCRKHKIAMWVRDPEYGWIPQL